MVKPPKIGDIIRVTFLDHAENSRDSISFEAFGRVTDITKTAYKITAWGYIDPTDRARDHNEDNEHWYCIVRKAITDIKILK
jgi:hypothetical protein